MKPATTPQGAQLTQRQARFVSLAKDGKNHEEIAEICRVSTRTVSSVLYFVRNRDLATSGERILTARQLEILRLFGAGLSTAQIGAELFLSPWTVVNHLRDARSRLGAKSSLNAVMLAISRELLILDHDGQLLIPHPHRVAA